jgi:iron(III) transport system ATP-binding protein
MRREVEAILRGNGIAAIFVTHDREEAFAIADRVGIMNRGHLDQLDAPDVIYHSPATRFAAQMAGTCDFVRGEAHGGVAMTELGKLPCVSNNGPLPEGRQVDLLVHPDDFQLLPDPQGRAVVRSREFRGDETVLVIALPSGATLRCRQRSYSRLTPGARVTLVSTKALPFLAFRRAPG